MYRSGPRRERRRHATGGGATTTLDTRLSPEGDVSGRIAVDNDAVHWTSDTNVMRIGLDRIGFKSLAANNQGIRSMTLRPTDIYWGAAETIAISNGEEQTSGK
jgi:hypothetical protein